MLFYLRFRCVQLFRAVREAGWALVLIAILLTAGVWLRAIDLLLGLPIWAVALASFVLSALFHLNRQDKTFLGQTEVKTRTALLIDYFLVGVVLSACFLFSGQFLKFIAAYTGLICAVIPLPNSRIARNQASFLPNLPPTYFEWNGIVRRRPFYFLVLIGLQLACGVHIAFWGIFFLVLISIFPEIFEANESRAIRPANWQALLKKNREMGFLLLLFCLPAIAIALLKAPAWWPLVVYGMVSIFTTFKLYFWYKYANWTPFLEKNNNGPISMIAFFAVLLPGFILVAMGMVGLYFFRAKKQFQTHINP